MNDEPQVEPAATDKARIYSVALFDIIPDRKADGTALLSRYAEALRLINECLRADLIRQQPPTNNHFALLSVWRSAMDRDRHLASAVSRDFRTAFQPLAASPVDDRIYTEATP